jgi:hypothetical protein
MHTSTRLHVFKGAYTSTYTYIDAHINGYMHGIHAPHAYIHAYIHTYVHTYIHNINARIQHTHTSILPSMYTSSIHRWGATWFRPHSLVCRSTACESAINSSMAGEIRVDEPEHMSLQSRLRQAVWDLGTRGLKKASMMYADMYMCTRLFSLCTHPRNCVCNFLTSSPFTGHVNCCLVLKRKLQQLQ